MTELLKTQFYKYHKKQAKLIEFCGYEMPLYYSTIIREHNAIRKYAGVFDVSHMGRVIITGIDTKKLLDSSFNGQKAVVMYGYDYQDFPIDLILGCFELLAEKYFCKLTEQYEHPFEGLIHPIHKKGKVKGYLLDNL